MDISGKPIVVTGAAGGIGRAIVSALHKAGARVAAVDMATDGIDSSLAVPFACDVSDLGSVDAVQGALKEWTNGEPLAGLVNTAGIVRDEPLFGIGRGGFKLHDLDAWDQTIAVNLTGTFRMTRALIPLMAAKRKGAVIVNFSSVSRHGNAGQSAYAAAKAGIEALTRSWALELGFFAVRAVAIAPGIVATPMSAAIQEAKMEEYKKRMPQKRLATPEEVAAMVLTAFTNDYLNGTTLEIDGGFTY